MVTEDLMKKYKYGYVHSCKLLEDPFVKDLLKENQELKKNYENAVADYETAMAEKEQLKDNWNNLKEYLESMWEESQDIWFVKIINKMGEIEK